MSLRRTELVFPSRRAAQRWFEQLAEQWELEFTEIQEPHPSGGVLAVATFVVEHGALVRTEDNPPVIY